MRYCGNCGAPLDDRAIAARRCDHCGAEVHSTGDIRYEGDGGTQWVMPAAMPQPRERPTSGPPPQWAVSAPPSSNTPARNARLSPGCAFGAGSAVTLAVIILLVILSAHHLRARSSGAESAPAQQTAGATHHPGSATTPTPDATPLGSHATATASPNGTGTPAPIPDPAPTATVLPASLSVQPTSFSFTFCANRTIHFTISNTGQATMNWKTQADNDYTITPAMGALTGNSQQSVQVSGITSTGTGNITVSANGARNQPIIVTIRCNI